MTTACPFDRENPCPVACRRAGVFKVQMWFGAWLDKDEISKPYTEECSQRIFREKKSITEIIGGKKCPKSQMSLDL